MAITIENLEKAFDEMFDFITDLPSGLDGFESDFDLAFKELKELKAALTPPNEPLMPDELKEMGGKPVWTVGVSYTDDGKWAMWDMVEKADNEGVDFGYSTESREWWNYNLRDKDGKLLNCAWVCYRRPTEGEV